MTVADLSPLANHVWQSTIFVVAAWVLTLALRKNRASVRYWIWFSASLKFLIPFSLLISIGNKFAWHSSPTITQPQFTKMINEISQPFASINEPSIAIAPQNLSSAFPILLLATWLCGAIIVLIFWLRSLQQVCAIKRTGSPLSLNLPIPVMSSPARMEPGVFGIFHPVLILPDGITDRLTPAQLKSVIAHELCHVRRKDNLTAAIHMLVETIFWFHPFVWWIQTRLVAERERSCDESVVATANNPQIYAEAILNVCKLYIEAPVRCVSGVTGSGLKKRIRAILRTDIAGDLSFGRKVMLALAAGAAFATPVLLGMIGASPARAQPQSQNSATVAPEFEFEVASIKPSKPGNDGWIHHRPIDGLNEENFPPLMLIQLAYGIYNKELIAGAPNWLNSEKYDVDAKMERSVAEAYQKLSPAERSLAMQHMLQKLLADRFKLTVHRGTKELPVFWLVIAKSGPKLHEANSGDTYANGLKGADGRALGTGTIRATGKGEQTFQGIPIATLINMLAQDVDRPVLDRTGLTGRYDFKLQWMPDDSSAQTSLGGAADSTSALPPPDSNGLSLFTALQEQLGLKLEPGKGPAEIIVIDHIERPSGN